MVGGCYGRSTPLAGPDFRLEGADFPRAGASFPFGGRRFMPAGAAVETFVVACPMYVTMFEDGRKTGDFEDDLDVVGITELLAEALDDANGDVSAD